MNRNQPAFPHGPLGDSTQYEDGRISYQWPAGAGMSLLDYFAAHETLAEFDNPDCSIPVAAYERYGGKAPEGGWSKNALGMLERDAKVRAALKYMRARAMVEESIKNRNIQDHAYQHNPDTAERMHRSPQSKVLVFDIETEGRTEVVDSPGDWYRPDGRLTGQAKVDADLKRKAEDQAALHPTTGRILAIGYSNGDQEWVKAGEEKDICDGWINACHFIISNGGRIYTFNGNEFDISFIAFRCMANGVKLLPSLGGFYRSRFQPSECFQDLHQMVRFGRYASDGYSLDRVCRALGIGQKTGSGKDFAKLLREDPEKAKEYLLNDVRLTYNLAKYFV